MLNYVQPDIPTWGHQRPKRFLKAMRKILLRTEAKDYRITVLKPGYYKVGFTFHFSTMNIMFHTPSLPFDETPSDITG